MRIAALGPRTWFANHFPEGWEDDPAVLALDATEGDFSWMVAVRNFHPDVTLFYRPELYPARYLRLIPGFRLAFLSEPLPALGPGGLEATEESALRLRVYAGMAWDCFHRVLFYDPGRAATARHLDWKVDGFRPLPVDIRHFHPGPPDAPRPVDVCFVGKPTTHRMAVLDALRLAPFRFLWVAHGVAGPALADLFRRCRLVLNLHADGVPALEPRLFLAACCGCVVATEPLSSPPGAFGGRIRPLAPGWDAAALGGMLAAPAPWTRQDEADRLRLSVRRLLAEETGLPVPAAPPTGPAVPDGALTDALAR